MGKKGGGGGRRAGGGGKKKGGGGGGGKKNRGGSAAKKISKPAKAAAKHVSHGASKARHGARHATRGARSKFNPMVFHFGKPLHRRIRAVNRFASSIHHQKQYNNCRSGYCRYDNVNAYHHRHYHRAHRYPVHYSSSNAVTYHSLRSTLPPNSVNFCFISIDDLSQYTTGDPNSTALYRLIFALLYRPPTYPNPLPSSAQDDVRKSLESFAAKLHDAEESSPPGFTWPDWLFACCGGCSTTAAYREECVENAILEITADMNGSDLFSIRGIVATYVDIGDVLQGFAIEVLPILPSDRVVNPHFVGESAPLAEEEVRAISLQGRAARGDDIDETEYDSAFNAAAEAIAVAEPIAASDTPFTITVPAGVTGGYTLTVQSPVGYLLNITVPSDVHPGASLLITPPSPENSAPTATVYQPAASNEQKESQDDAPPPYASILYTIPDDEEDSAVPSQMLHNSTAATTDVAPLLMERI